MDDNHYHQFFCCFPWKNEHASKKKSCALTKYLKAKNKGKKARSNKPASQAKHIIFNAKKKEIFFAGQDFCFLTTMKTGATKSQDIFLQNSPPPPIVIFFYLWRHAEEINATLLFFCGSGTPLISFFFFFLNELSPSSLLICEYNKTP